VARESDPDDPDWLRKSFIVGFYDYTLLLCLKPYRVWEEWPYDEDHEPRLVPDHSIRLLTARAHMLYWIRRYERERVRFVEWRDAGFAQCTKCRARSGKRMRLETAKRVLATEFCVAGHTKKLGDPLQGCRCVLRAVLPDEH
jgi:hypothetical protein